MLHEGLLSSHLFPADYADMFSSTGSVDFASAPSSSSGDGFVDGVGRKASSDGRSGSFSWTMEIPDDRQPYAVTEDPAAFNGLDSQAIFPDPLPDSRENQFEVIQRPEYRSDGYAFDLTAPGWRYNSHKYSPVTEDDDTENNRRVSPESQGWFCIASDNTATQVARSTMTRNLIKIYHDSMEHALSCWLTEHNCPYSSSVTDVLPLTERKEWGPSWSNRMCIRVCRLDRAATSIRGRALSAEEDKTAARALHLAIVAFASQWTQHAQKGTGLSVPAAIASDERSIREKVWNEARHALEHSTGVPSFRVAFANIIFSLTQSPLDDRQDARLDELLESDRAPIFLENANRLLFTFRHKFTRLKRGAVPNMRDLRRGSMESSMGDVLDISTPSEPSRADPILASHEHRNTLSLMFWLGVMFDTLSAAMYQRPLVVSDEDSQIASASPVPIDPDDPDQEQVDLDSWSISQSGFHKKQDVWGEFFLRTPVERHESTDIRPRWPCSYEIAASVLSEATPVKVLLYRRVTQLNNLIYRGASRARLEEVIQKALRVYDHWNCTYQRFMLDCVANHELLPPRIQSWYVILDGHWHLAAMLLADVLESIDNGRLGSEAERAARQTTDLVSTLRIDNALAVGALARSSLQGQEPTMYRDFHDSLNEVAFLVEPWTVVLIHSFAKAGYICLESLHVPDENNMLAECFRQNCEFCICALQYLGRKSDMAFLVARNLSRSLDLKLSGRP